MNNIELTLTIDEINDLLKIIGSLPTSSGAYPLMMKILNQAEREQQVKTRVENISPK